MAVARYTRRRKQASNARYPVANGGFPFGEPDRPGAETEGVRNGEYVKRDRGFESISLQRGVTCEPRRPGARSAGARTGVWLGEEPVDPRQLKALLAPYPSEQMI